MTSHLIHQPAQRRNARDGHERPLVAHHQSDIVDLTPGAREVYRRTRWSASLCRTVAHLAGFAEVEAH